MEPLAPAALQHGFNQGVAISALSRVAVLTRTRDLGDALVRKGRSAVVSGKSSSTSLVI